MKRTSGNSEKESTEALWPRVLRITNRDEFQQCLAVAQLAVKLCELEIAKRQTSLQKENLDPANFLDQAWKLIESARKHALRPQTDTEYLVEHGGSYEAVKNVVGRRHQKSRVPFEKLCDPEYNNKGDTEMILGVKWKVHRSECRFDDLFRAYWRDVGEKWKEGNPPIPIFFPDGFAIDSKPVAVRYSEAECEKIAAFARDTDAWKKRGEQWLKLCKKEGFGSADFLELARFRGYCDFESQVKVITGEDRLDRALPRFRRFLKSHFANEVMAERAMAEHRERAFAAQQLDSFKDEFAKWKRMEKSSNAKLSREARGKRGRVRSKGDKRLGDRPPW